MRDLEAVLIRLMRELAESSEQTVTLARIASEAAQENAKLRDMLRRLEWADFDGVDWQCSICQNAESIGHRAGCELAALLQEDTK